MSLLLYINGQLAHLAPGQVIAQTRQVNDLNSLETRQAGYTNKFSLPKTAGNVKIMQFLTLPGNTSNVPYQENTCSLYSHTGECFVYNGRAVITDGGDAYECVVYDGIIDLYKAIENKTLADLDLTELNHTKDVATVKLTSDISSVLPYRYILADYNGKMSAEATQVNIDYLIPSVSVSYLWQKIFDTHGFQGIGAVFNTQGFKNLWLTFPKSVNAGETETELFSSDDYDMPQTEFFVNINSAWLDYNTADINGITTSGNRHLTVAETGYYRIDVSGTLQITNDVVLYYAKNAENFATNTAPFTVPVGPVIQNNLPFSFTKGLYLNAQDSVSLMLKKSTNPFKYNTGGQLQVRLVKINNSIDFNNAFKSFTITDFLKEIVHRFGLTIFKDKEADVYRFLTLYEMFQLPGYVNWSGKFSKKVSENYIHGSYAQRNMFRYNYNDKESSYNDGYLDVQNVNLAETKDVIKSKIYSPELKTTTLLSRSTNVYKFWDKEISNDAETGEQSVKYKPLDSRYYLMRAQSQVQGISLYSEAYPSQENTIFSWRESFYKLPFQDVIQEYYLPIRQVLNRGRIITAHIWLTDADICSLDFKKLYYIEQLSSYFLINKISNYIPGKVTSCELVAVEYSPQPQPDEHFVLTNIAATPLSQIAISYTRTIQHWAMFQISYDGVFYQDYATSSSSPFITAALPPGTYYFRISYSGYSNVLTITLP